MVWRAEDPQGFEADKVKYDIVEYTRGIVLDLGCGPRKAFPHFLGIDSCKDTELFGIPMKPDVKVDDCADLVGTSEEAINRGFAPETLDSSGRQDSDGTNYVGNPFEREGFLTPGLGYDR